jgi:hypothetical protein
MYRDSRSIVSGDRLRLVAPGSGRTLAGVVVALTLAGCGGGGSSRTAQPSVATSTTAVGGTASSAISNRWTAPAVDPKALPLGDGHVSTTEAGRGSVYACRPPGPVGGATGAGTWIGSTTWDSTAKIAVQGSVSWPDAKYTEGVSGSTRTITTNDLPVGYQTGTFPIAQADPAHQYDGNPNSISTHTTTLTLPASPTAGAEPRCLSDGPVGVLVDGVFVFDALDGPHRDAVAHEIQDGCNGHPGPGNQYHYHSVSSCLLVQATGPSTLAGWAFDGYPIFVERDAAGHLPTDGDLDECHGRRSPVLLGGGVVTTYHYDATLEYPYTVGCYRGTQAAAGG